jgi:hypothetical protein
MGQALDHFIHRAIAAENQDQIGSLMDGFLNQRARLSGRGSGKEARSEIYAGKSRNGTLENNVGIAPRHASGGIIDQDRLAKQSDHYT